MKPKTKRARRWQSIFQPRQGTHDPMLVFNMSIFNSDRGWQETLSPLKIRENVG
jgi:hypothetical protein